MLSLDVISSLTRDVARSLSLEIEVAGVTRGAHDGEYAEVLLTVLGCETESCRLLVGVSRVAPLDDVRRVLAEALRDHATQHPGTSPPVDAGIDNDSAS